MKFETIMMAIFTVALIVLLVLYIRLKLTMSKREKLEHKFMVKMASKELRYEKSIVRLQKENTSLYSNKEQIQKNCEILRYIALKHSSDKKGNKVLYREGKKMGIKKFRKKYLTK